MYKTDEEYKAMMRTVLTLMMENPELRKRSDEMATHMPELTNDVASILALIAVTQFQQDPALILTVLNGPLEVLLGVPAKIAAGLGFAAGILYGTEGFEALAAKFREVAMATGTPANLASALFPFPVSEIDVLTDEPDPLGEEEDEDMHNSDKSGS